jgi:transposase
VGLTMTAQRYRAVLEVQAGVPVIEVAERFGVSRQAVHRWRRWYEDEGLDGLADRSPGRSRKHHPRRGRWSPGPPLTLWGGASGSSATVGE